jgi:hypothetical protein
MMVSARWRNSVVAACSIALVVVLAGCGTQQYDPNAQGRTTSPSAEPTSTPTAGDSPMSMPLQLRRTGGIAGFNDNLTVKEDGTATLVSRGKRPLTCKVEPATFEKLTQALQSVDTSSIPAAKPTRTPPIADEIYLTLIVGGETIRYQNLGESAPAWKPLFEAMQKILSSAFALQNGTTEATGGACAE